MLIQRLARAVLAFDVGKRERTSACLGEINRTLAAHLY